MEVRIKQVFINEKEKLALVIGKGIPVQTIRNFEFEGWDTIIGNDGKPLFDMNAWADDIPKTKPSDPQEINYGVQYCGLIELDEPRVTNLPDGRVHTQTHEMDDCYENPDEVIITEESLMSLVKEIYTNNK
jgi:hypothetical protein